MTETSQKSKKILDIPRKGEQIDDEQYAKLLNTYVTDVRKVEQLEKQRHKEYLLEQIYSYSFFDLIFPYHMYLGKFEHDNPSLKQTLENQEDYQFTTIRTFKRRRMYLLWLFYEKFDRILTEEQKERRNFAEHTMFKWNFGLKLMSAFTFLYVLSRRRHANPRYVYDFFLVYSASYMFILSHIMGVYKAWPLYADIAKKAVLSKQNVTIDDNVFMDDFKVQYYKYDIALSSII
ncbi:UNKNOWN [Stylonychia lemnae]|uniref:Uncharacterized protein n=1 Tax=Stylonychia lemnae TaxID=5949 RepID=A0A078A142_STYLE|nr:UNKNOWN [Stylonychia lemnae]|eukprot:CDW75567.1 UNKNOWN [Stylonychia lemnae]